jgi:hypothetical protein
MLTLTKFYQDNVAVWAQKIISDVSAQVKDRRFIKTPSMRESILSRLYMLFELFHNYTFLLLMPLSSAPESFKDVQAVLAPTKIPFLAVQLLEKVLPTEQDISDMVTGVIPKFSEQENTLITQIIGDSLDFIEECGVAHVSEHHKKLVKDPNAELQSFCEALRVVCKAFVLSDAQSGVFEITGATKSSRGLQCVWDNLPRTSESLVKLERFFMKSGEVSDNTARFLSKDALAAFYKALKTYLYVAAVKLAEAKGSPTDGDHVYEQFRHFNDAIAGFASLSKDLYKKSAATKQTYKYLAAEKIQKDVAETCIAMYELATNRRNGLTPGLRMQICWAAAQMLSIHGTAFVAHHGRDSYLANPLLSLANYTAKCWSAIMFYYSKLPDDQKDVWNSENFSSMTLWAAHFFSAIDDVSGKDTQDLQGSQFVAILQPTTLMSTVFAKEVDCVRVLNTVESMCQMGSTLPVFFKATKHVPLGIGFGIVTVVKAVSGMMKRVELIFYAIKGPKLERKVPDHVVSHVIHVFGWFKGSHGLDCDASERLPAGN